MTIQERHCIEENIGLPQAERDYAGFRTPSAHGQAALRKLARHAREMAKR
ncbi:MAG: hypothetical protein ACLQIB_12635 [Isosphaeraceae bacterium]